MGILTLVEEKTICRLFDIKDGYIFKWCSDKGSYNKNETQRMILQSCGINIYEDDEYRNLSQEKCIRKIWAKGSPQMIANLLETFSQYFCFLMGTDEWPDMEKYDYNQVQGIIKRLKEIASVELPTKQSPEDLTMILEDIERNIHGQKPELVIDRLHTFACEYLRKLCDTHGIQTKESNGNELPLHSLVGMLAKWYAQNGYCDTEFTQIACKCSISLFEKYNHVRNDHSAAHPNQLLSKAEAEYVVRIVADTLTFFDKLEQNHNHDTISWDDGMLFLNPDDELPF